MKSKNRKDALVEEDKTNVMNLHGRTEKEPRDFLSWLEILKHFVQVYDVDQHQSAEKLVYKTVRLHGSRWQKAHQCLPAHGYSEKTETPSHPECSEKIEVENSAPPTICILGLGCTRAMGS